MQALMLLFLLMSLASLGGLLLIWRRGKKEQQTLRDKISSLSAEIDGALKQHREFQQEIAKVSTENSNLRADIECLRVVLDQKISSLNDDASQGIENYIERMAEINLRKVQIFENILQECLTAEEFAGRISREARVVDRKARFEGYSAELGQARHTVEEFIHKLRNGGAALTDVLLVLRSRMMDDTVGDVMFERIKKVASQIEHEKTKQDLEDFEIRRRREEFKKIQDMRDALYAAEIREREQTIPNPKLGKMAVDP